MPIAFCIALSVLVLDRESLKRWPNCDRGFWFNRRPKACLRGLFFCGHQLAGRRNARSGIPFAFMVPLRKHADSDARRCDAAPSHAAFG